MMHDIQVSLNRTYQVVILIISRVGSVNLAVLVLIPVSFLEHAVVFCLWSSTDLAVLGSSQSNAGKQKGGNGKLHV